MSFSSYLSANWHLLVTLTIQHAELVLASVAIATVVGVALGVATYQTEVPRRVALAIAGIFLTIPSFALFGLLIGPLGLGYKPALIALVMYALLPVLRNTITGLNQVPAAITESAKAMGMGRWRRLARVELPLAWPVIIAGVRVATLINVGIAAIAAYVGGPGLGRQIFSGLDRIGFPVAVNLALSGVLGIILIGLVLDLAFLGLGKLTTSRGIRV